MRIDRSRVEVIMARECITYADIAKKTFSNPRTITRSFEQGVSPRTAGRIAKALNVDIAEILAGDEHA